jgi:hypothetical protein
VAAAQPAPAPAPDDKTVQSLQASVAALQAALEASAQGVSVFREGMRMLGASLVPADRQEGAEAQQRVTALEAQAQEMRRVLALQKQTLDATVQQLAAERQRARDLAVRCPRLPPLRVHACGG